MFEKIRLKNDEPQKKYQFYGELISVDKNLFGQSRR
jgi:hypothetical protein